MFRDTSWRKKYRYYIILRGRLKRTRTRYKHTVSERDFLLYQGSCLYRRQQILLIAQTEDIGYWIVESDRIWQLIYLEDTWNYIMPTCIEHVNKFQGKFRPKVVWGNCILFKARRIVLNFFVFDFIPYPVPFLLNILHVLD